MYNDYSHESCMTDFTIKPGITDIHMHVIPSVDDGADSFDTPIQMLKTAYHVNFAKKLH